MKKRFLCICFILVLSWVFCFPQTVAFAAAEYRTIRVKISIGDVISLNVNLSGDYSVLEDASIILASGSYTVSVSGSQVYLKGSGVDRLVGDSLTFVRCVNGNGMTLSNAVYGDINYLGNMRFTVVEKQDSVGNSIYVLNAVNTVPLEQYLYGVVAYEMSDSFPLEALKVQAVCARNYAIKSMSSSGEDDIGDTSSDQVYRGYNPVYTNVISAVDSTKGQVLMYNSAIIQTNYSASNGGQTELPGNAWGGGTAKNNDYPYLTQQNDPYDLANPSCQFQKIFVPRQVEGLAPYDCVTIDSPQVVRIVRCMQYTNVRSTPDSTVDTNIIGTAPVNTLYTYVATTPDGVWQQIKFKNSANNVVDAYVSASYANIVTNGRYMYANAGLADLQNLAYTKLTADGISITSPTDVKIITVNSLVNGDKRWPGTDSRSYVTAKASVTINYIPKDSSALTGSNTTIDQLVIALMNPIDGGYELAHTYLMPSLRLRGVESSATDSSGNAGFCITNLRYGHGVGMSQRGAQTMAAAPNNKLYHEILSFYFVGTTLSTVDTTIPALPGKVPPPVLSIKTYKVIGNMMIGLSADLDMNAFLSNISVQNGSARIIAASGGAKTSGVIVTGDVLEVVDLSGRSCQKITLILYGDVNADGKISLVDLLRIQKHLLGTSGLGGANSTAGDVSKDGSLTILDLLKVQKHLLGTVPIDQNK